MHLPSAKSPATVILIAETPADEEMLRDMDKNLSGRFSRQGYVLRPAGYVGSLSKGSELRFKVEIIDNTDSK